jgi:hypothetical protein
MTTTYKVELDEKIKTEFLKISKENGLEHWMVIQYFMQSFIEKPKKSNFNIEKKYLDWIVDDIEFEKFSENNLKELIDDDKIIENTLKMEKYFLNK